MKNEPEIVSHDNMDGDGINGIRIDSIDTKESQGDPSKITQEGKDASAFAKRLVPEGTSIQTEGERVDTFDRRLSQVTYDVDDVEIDHAFVMMHNEYSDYYIKYGENRNPANHELYKTFYSNDKVYQVGGGVNPRTGKRDSSFRDDYTPLNENEYNDISAKITAFKAADVALAEGKGSQKAFNSALSDLYKDKSLVARHTQDTFDRAQGLHSDGTRKYSGGRLAPTELQTYLRDLAVRNTDNTIKTTYGTKPEKVEGSMLDVAFSKFNTVALLNDTNALRNARTFGGEINVDESVYTAGVPAQFLPMLQEEAVENGSYAASVMSEQLLKDVADGTVWDNAQWWEQALYGSAAFLADPTMILTGGAIKVAQGGALATKLGTTSARVQANVARPWQATGVKFGTSSAKWATAFGAEESVLGAVRLSSDHTYNVKDLQMDILVGTALGGVLGPIAKAGKEKFSPMWTNIQQAEKKVQSEFNTHSKAKQAHIDKGGKLSKDVVGDFVPPKVNERVTPAQAIGGLDVKPDHRIVELNGTKTDLDLGFKRELDSSLSNLYLEIDDFGLGTQKTELDNALKGGLVSKFVSMQWAGDIFTDVATRFQSSKVDSLKWFGVNVTESGKGFSGTLNRQATGGLMKRMIADRSLGKVLPAYSNIIDEYVARKGGGSWAKLNAQQMDGKSNPIVKQFHEETFIHMENKRLGKPTGNIDPSIEQFSKQWDDYMSHNHGELVQSVKGFTADRARKHYIPRITSPSKMKSMERSIGKNGVIKLLRSAFQEIHNRTGMKIGDEGYIPVNDSAASYYKSINDKKWAGNKGHLDMEDDYSPLQDAASRERIDFDITHSVDINGVNYRIMDLLNTELPEIATKYSERTSGLIGLSKSTNGTISSPVDIQAMRAIIKKESVDKGLSKGEINNNLSLYDDVIDQMLGRPAKFFRTEGAAGRAERAVTGTNMVGLPEEVRQFKDATALAQLGGLGAAQLAEVGDAIQRTIMNGWDNRKAVDNLLGRAGVDISNKADRDSALREITELTGLTKEMEWLDRQAVHIDQGDLEHIGKLRAASLQVANVMTFGKHKAPASRMLAKTTGFNMIRKHQFAVAQSSTGTAVARLLTGRTTSFNKNRLRDLGLDTPAMQKAMKNVTFSSDNQVKSYNFDKWDGEALDAFIYGIYRDATQSVQRTLVGERPAWLNRPMMQLLTQYLEMPIVAMNKKLGRQVQFADKEAVLNMSIFSAMGGLTKYAYDELGDAITGRDGQDKEITDLSSLTESEAFQAMKYTPALAFVPDVLEWVGGKEPNVPILGMMEQYRATGEAAGDVATGDGSAKDFVDTAARLAPLSTTIYAKGIARLNDEMTK